MIRRPWPASIALACSLLALFAAAPGAAQQIREDDGPFQALAFRDPRLRPEVVIAPYEAVKPELGADVRDGWAGFLIGAGAGWKSEVDRRNGHLEFIEGAGIPWVPGAGNNLTQADIGGKADLPRLEKIARGFLPRVARVLGFDVAMLRLSQGRSGLIGDHLWLVDFDVVREGRVVEGARVVFRINNGNLVQIGTENLPPLDAAVPQQRIDRGQAAAALEAYIGGAGGLTPADHFVDAGSLHLLPVAPEGATGSVVRMGEGRELALVWDVTLRRRGTLGTWRGRVDATTGKVLAFEDVNAYAQVNGGVYPQSSAFHNETVLPMPYADLSSGGYTDSSGWYIFPGTPVSSLLSGQYVRISDYCGPISQTSNASGKITFGTSGGVDCTTPGSGGSGNTHSSRTQFYHVNRIKEVGRAWLPANTWLQGQLSVNVNIPSTCNAYWNGSSLNFFLSGGGCANTGEIAGVSLHEYGHGLDQNDGNGFSPDNGTGEAYADITAAVMLHSSCEGPGFFLNQTCGGYGDACTTCSGVRDIDWAGHVSNTPHTVGNFTQVRCPYGGGYDGPCGEEGHCESYVISESVWDFAARDLPSPGTAAAWSVAERLWYQSRSTSSSAFVCHTNTSTWTSDGCATGSLWRTMRAADDDDGNLANGTPHSCQLFAAFNRHGLACASDPGANVCFAACTPPPATAVTLTPGNRQVQVSWTSSGPGASYDVYRSEAGCDSGLVKIADDVNGTSLVDTHVANGLTYSYRVISQALSNGSCAAAPSVCQAAVPQAPACGSLAAPTGLIATGGKVDRVTLSWNAVPGATEYHVYRSATSGGPYVQVTAVAAPTTTVDDGGLGQQATYYYVVRAAVDECESGNSGQASAGTASCKPVTLYTNNFETGSGRADWATGVFSGASDSDWRGIRSCAAHGGTNEFRFGGDTCSISYGVDESIYAQPQGTTGISVPANAGLDRLTFWHRWSFEGGYDGGALTVSVDGVHYVPVPAAAIVGGATYNGQIYNDCEPPGTGGTPTFTGSRSSFAQTKVDLDAACNAASGTTAGCAGRSVRIGFTGISDCIYPYLGWDIDDVQVTSCLPQSCTGQPIVGAATVPGNNQIQVGWSQGAPVSPSFNVYRALGTCAAPGAFTRVASGVAGTAYLDTDVSGGSTYAYRIAGVDSSGGCESELSVCIQATATGACTLPPTFAGLASVTDPVLANCTLSLSWSAATPHCGSGVSYDVFRSTTPDFTPSAANRIATGETGTTFADASLDFDQTYYYVVRAIDTTTAVSDANAVRRSAHTSGPIFQIETLADSFEDADGFDLAGWTHAKGLGTVDWVWSNAISQSPTRSWFSASQTQPSDRVLTAPSFRAGPSTVVSFWHAFDTEPCFDGATLEMSTDGGASWTVVPDHLFLSGGFNGTISSSSNPISGKRGWCGRSAGYPAMTQVRLDFSSLDGTKVTLRWHAGDDDNVSGTGWYVDSVQMSDTKTGGTCVSAPPAPLDLYTLTPCRLVDTRNPAGSLGGPSLTPGATRRFVLAGACGLPLDARAVSVNLTVVPGANGNLTVFPADRQVPLASAISFQGGLTRANNALILLSDGSGAIEIKTSSVLPVDFILDVNGYFK